MRIIFEILAILLSFVAGLLVGRKNPKVAQTAAEEVEALKDMTKK